jgi:perosamine synthetase
VVLYDLEPTTLSPDPISLGEAIAAGAAAVVVVHLFGYPVDVDAVREVAGSAVIVEDAAQAAGGRLRGRSLGALGDLAVLSFGRGKGMSAGGGGALLAVNGSWASAIRDAAGMLEAGGGGAMAVAMSLAQWVLARPALFAIPSAIPQLRLGEMIYHEPGAVREMSDASAYLVPRAIELSEAAVAGRQRVAVQLTGACAGGLAFVEPLADSQPGFLRLAVRVASGVRAPYSLGVVRPYPVSLADHAAMQAVLQERRDAPGARELAAELVTLPTHEYLDSGDIARVSEWLVEAGNGGARANATFSGSESSS